MSVPCQDDDDVIKAETIDRFVAETKTEVRGGRYIPMVMSTLLSQLDTMSSFLGLYPQVTSRLAGVVGFT
jgi:hypothetical protein